ncbi:MAG: c-type cytochrome [Burkholderiales bacterium]|nr:c-type cytochrome [Burkholderiales bacterium]
MFRRQGVRTAPVAPTIGRGLLGALAAVFVALAAADRAAADEKLARARHCFACHQVEKKLVGPAYRDIAARYRNDTGAEARLTRKIREGGVGDWGVVAMAPNPALTEADARTLARWVLSLGR